MSTSQNVINFRRRIKEALVYAFGEKCQLCGKTYPNSVFDFHHIKPEEKSFGLGGQSTTHSKANNAKEAKKCCMLCANCHRIIEHEKNNIQLICDFNEEKFYNKIDELANRNKEIQEKKKKETVNKPSREVLKEQIRTMPFLQIGKLYGVSDNAIRKWCDKYGLPRKVTDIKQYSDEEWEKI